MPETMAQLGPEDATMLDKNSLTALSGGELVVRTLIHAGVTHVYLLYGGHMQPICEGIRAHGLSYVDMRHEVTAGYAAQGWARATDSFGVAVVSAAPGFTNIISSIANAYCDRTAVVYISTSAALGDAETNNFMSGIDPVAMIKPVTKWAHCVTRTEDIPRLLAHAIRIATSPPNGPVLLDIPWDVVFGRSADGDVDIPKLIQFEADPLPRPQAVEQALRLLSSARRPAIVAGEGAAHRGVAEELRAFVSKTGIPVFATYDAYGLLPDNHSLYAGGARKMTRLREPGNSPDVVLALGIRFGFMTVGPNGLVPAGTEVIQVDVDPKEIGRTRAITVPMVASSREALRALNAGCASHSWPDWSAWHRILQDSRAAHRTELDAQAAGRELPIPPYLAARAIVDSVGDDVFIVADGADAHMWIAEAARPDEPGRFFSHSSYFGCLGYGLGFAMGVQNAHPGKRVVCVIGDGALGLTLAEFHTLARHNLPIVVVVMNNRAWGATSHYQDTTVFAGNGQHFATDLNGAEYHAVAAALGCHAALVTRVEQLGPAMKAAFASGKAACINVEIAREDVPPDHKALTFLRA
jgi:acetolactate synthase-1/2/3 large subunit